MKPFDIVNCEHHRTVWIHANSNDTILKQNFEKERKNYYFSYRHCSLSQQQEQHFFSVFLVLVTHMWLSPILLMAFFSTIVQHVRIWNHTSTSQWTVNRTAVRTKKNRVQGCPLSKVAKLDFIKLLTMDKKIRPTALHYWPTTTGWTNISKLRYSLNNSKHSKDIGIN